MALSKLYILGKRNYPNCISSINSLTHDFLTCLLMEQPLCSSSMVFSSQGLNAVKDHQPALPSWGRSSSYLKSALLITPSLFTKYWGNSHRQIICDDTINEKPSTKKRGVSNVMSVRSTYLLVSNRTLSLQVALPSAETLIRVENESFLLVKWKHRIPPLPALGNQEGRIWNSLSLSQDPWLVSS